MNHDWKIKSRSLSCCDTGRDFVEDEPFYTALFEDTESDGYVRKDYSEKAWKNLQESVSPFSFWRSTFEAPPPHAEEVVKKENAESLLRQLIEDDAPNTENTRYILAVMLERKKILHQIDAKPLKSGRLLIYERRKTGEAFIVRDPQLKLEEIDSVQEEVASLLSSSGLGGNKAPSETEAQPATGAP